MSANYHLSIQCSSSLFCVTTAQEMHRVWRWLKNKSRGGKNDKTWHNVYQAKSQAKTKKL